MFKQKLKWVKIALSKQSKETYGDIFKHIAIREDIVSLKEMLFVEEPTSENRIILQRAQVELINNLSLDEQFWSQKAGMNWFAKGDRNTSSFHNYVNGKRKKLQLKRIQDGNNNWLTTQELLANAAMNFYQDQFTQGVDPTNFEQLKNVPNMVTNAQSVELCRFPSMEEVKAATYALGGASTESVMTQNPTKRRDGA